MLAMNGSICCFTEAGAAPYFYLCDDSSFVRNRLPLLLQATKLTQNLALSLGSSIACWSASRRRWIEEPLYCFERVNRPLQGSAAASDRGFARLARKDKDLECGFSWLRQKPNRIGFSRNLDKGYFSSWTIPYAGI